MPLPTYTIAIPMMDTTSINSLNPTTNYFAGNDRAFGVSGSPGGDIIRRELAQVDLFAAHPWLAAMDIVGVTHRRIMAATLNPKSPPVAASRRCVATWIPDEATWRAPFAVSLPWGDPYWSTDDQILFPLPSVSAGDPFDLAITPLALDAIAERFGLLSLVTMLQNESLAEHTLYSESGQQGTTPHVLLIEFGLPGGRGYEVYCGNAVPVPGVDTPVAWLPPSASPSVSLAESGLDLQPDATYQIAVAAVNEVGRAATWPTFSFQTDAEAHPVQTPTPVHSLTATPRAGGEIEVRWTYDELTSLPVADEFTLLATSLTDSMAPHIVNVPAQAPRRDYRKALTLPGDRWRISVTAKRQGQYRGPVTAVDVNTTNQPAGTVIGLTAEEVV